MGTTDDPDKYPERHPVDTAADIAKGIASSAFPGAAALTTLIQTSHSRRLAAFHRRTAERLRALEDGSTSTLLQRAVEGNKNAREEIFSTYATITRLVQEAMDEEKRQALAAGMAASLLWPAEAEDLERRYFLRCLSEFEAIHMTLIVRARQGVAGVRDLVNAEGSLGENAKAAWKELNDRGMVNMESVNVMMTPSGTSADRTTPLGARFLRFIGREY